MQGMVMFGKLELFIDKPFICLLLTAFVLVERKCIGKPS
jgi:hypothetical protein